MGRVARPQSQSGCSEEVKNILPLNPDIYVKKIWCPLDNFILKLHGLEMVNFTEKLCNVIVCHIRGVVGSLHFMKFYCIRY